MTNSEMGAGGRPTPVLIVDDEADLREVMSVVLEDEGYRVATAATGPEALALLRASREPYVVLLDHHLAGMSGHTLLRALQSDPACPAHAVVYMSAGGASESAEVQAELSSLRIPYLHKPFDIDELLAQVAQGCSRVADARVTPGVGRVCATSSPVGPHRVVA